MLSSSKDKTIRIWVIGSLKLIHVIACSLYGWSTSLVTAGDWSVGGFDTATIHIWLLGTWENVRILDSHAQSCTMGEFLFSSSTNGTLEIWWMGTWECLRILKDHKSWVESLIVDKDRLF